MPEPVAAVGTVQPAKEIRRFPINFQKRAKLPDVRIHDLCHSVAPPLVSSGASLKMIGTLLGHWRGTVEALN